MLRGDPGYFRPLPLDTHADTPIWAHMLLIKIVEESQDERHAVILAHNYQTPDIFHTVADIVGDRVALAHEARVPRPRSLCWRASI